MTIKETVIKLLLLYQASINTIHQAFSFSPSCSSFSFLSSRLNIEFASTTSQTSNSNLFYFYNHKNIFNSRGSSNKIQSSTTSALLLRCKNPTKISTYGNHIIMYSSRPTRNTESEYDDQDNHGNDSVVDDFDDENYVKSKNKILYDEYENDDDDDDFDFSKLEKDLYEYDDSDYTEWTWESYQNKALVYLPPVTSKAIPKTIIHFIGGTLLGSFPRLFYGPLLQSIAQQTNSIIVATSIPVSFQSNPLRHDRLAYRLSKSFRDAYKNIICDEYGRKNANSMNIVGLGHSLGSRLHCIISCYFTRVAYPREGNVLISFNNYNSVSSVPGMDRLERGAMNTWGENLKRRAMERYDDDDYDDDDSYKRKKKKKYQDQDDFEFEYDDNEYMYEDRRVTDFRRREESKTKKERFSNSRYRYDFDDYDDDDDYFELEDIFLNVATGIRDTISDIKTAITPDLRKTPLEFSPTPDELWDSIQEGRYNTNAKKTLLIQFDKDTIDQSSKLASIISSADNDYKLQNEIDGNQGNYDIKFCRLKGTHLTPVNYIDKISVLNSWGSMDSLLQQALGEERKLSKRKSRRLSRNEIQENDDLTKSIVRYIDTIITSSNDSP